MTGVIKPGTPILDSSGRVAQLHGVGIQKVGDRWYAWGEDKTAGGTFTAVACYSTLDFANWRFEGNAIEASDGDLAPDQVIERPKVLRHPDGHWVLFLHVDSPDYGKARVGYAVAERPEGPYTYVGSERPLGNLSRDIGVYQEDGVGYLLSEDREGGLHIYRLREDYLAVDSVVVSLPQQARPEIGYESPTLIKHDGVYFIFGSDLTGWNLNDNKYATATALEGPWEDWKSFAQGSSTTFDSQVSVVVPTEQGYVYVGDRWDANDLFNSPTIILPMNISGTTATLNWHDEWTLDQLSTQEAEEQA